MKNQPLLLVSLLFASLQLGAAEQQSPPEFVGPGLSSEALAAKPQVPGAKGSQQRHYYFEEAGREMGYHLYVPENYDPAAPAPLVVLLHGFGVNQEFFFSFVEDLPELCGKYGFICVAPMGYSISGWYGAPMSIPGAPPPGSNLPVPQSGDAAEQLRERELSELDVLKVIDLVKTEYAVDSARTYLTGHSMGGFGTWYLGEKYMDRWAAIAPMSGINANALDALDMRKLAAIPVLVAVGEEEKPTVVESKKAVETLRDAGGEVVYVEIAGGTHGSMVAPSTALIMEFFAKH